VQYAIPHGQVRRAYELNAYKREIRLIEVKIVKTLGLDTSWRPLTNSTRVYAHAKSCKVALHTILLGVEGSINTSNTLHHLKELGLDSQRAHKAALKLHVHSVHYAHKLTRSRSEAGGCQPPSRYPLGSFSFGGGDSQHFGPMCLLFLNWCREYLRSIFFLFFFM
jgi:hypothetical protein